LAIVGSGWATAPLETLPLRERRHVPGATTYSEWTTRCRDEWQSLVGLIGFGENAPPIGAVALESDGGDQFLKNPCHHRGTILPVRLVVVAQPHTFHHPYNWLPAATHRQFRSNVERISDLILTGHEHEPDHYQKYSFKGEVNEYLEGAVFQEHAQPQRSGFHAVYIDLASQKQRTLRFSWQESLYLPDAYGDDWVGYTRGSRSGKRDFDLSDEYAKWLDDPGTSFTHPAKSDLQISDIFVFPNLKEFQIKSKGEFVYGALIEGRDVLKTLSAKRRVVFFGRQQAGKTTLSKVLFKDFYNKGLTPVLVSGDEIGQSHLDLRKLEDLVEAHFQKQYRNPLLPAFQQLDRDKTVLIIDDFDHAKLNPKGHLKLLANIHSRYERVFIFADDAFKLEEIIAGKASGEVLADYDQLEIVQFGHLLRSKLIEHWYGIGSEYVSNQEDLQKRIHDAERLITSLLGKNYLPSYPVFVLSLIQAHEAVQHNRSNVGTYGSLYEVLITQTLATRGSPANLDLKLTYLSELAFWMFSNQHHRITDDEWARFHAGYCEKYKIRPSRADLKRELTASRLLDLLDERYGFRHSYSYFYFVARYLRDNLAQAEVQSLVKSLCSGLHRQENASILLFLTHLSKDPFILDVILQHARSVYSRFEPARLEKDVDFLKGMAEAVDAVVLRDQNFAAIKEERLRRLDSAPEVPDETGDTPEGNEALRMIAELNTALRTLDLLGQLVKNYPGSLKGDDKFSLAKECYEVGLRTIAMFFDVFRTNAPAFVDLVLDRVIEKHPEIKDRDELKRNVGEFLFWLIEGSCFSLIKWTSLAVGHSQLGETYEDVNRAIDTNAGALVDISVKLDNLTFPLGDLEPLDRRFKKNFFCCRLLRQLVVEHFYLFPTTERTKQKICDTLGIPIQGVHQIDEGSKHEKKASRKQLRG
jgi:hypothetical protein